MQRLRLTLVLLFGALCALSASADPRLRCGNYCYYSWQTICRIDHPNGLPGNPNYCWDMYVNCLAQWGLDPGCDRPGTGIGDGDGPPSNCPIYVNLAEGFGQRDFGLTSVETGLHFDLNADGVAEQVAWAGPASTAALLVHPGPDGSVASGRDLFGNQSGWRNGYEMLKATFDTNGDGVISAQDARAKELYLWTDGQGGPGAVWDGIAQPSELRPFLSVIHQLWVSSRQASFVDDNGNVATWAGVAQLATTNPDGTTCPGRLVMTADWNLRYIP